jgi:hypothetical protein
VTDSTVRLYDSQESFEANPANHALVIHLSRKHELSDVKFKNYGRAPDGSMFDVNYFYIESGNGIWSNTRVLKIGSPDRQVIESLFSGIKRAMV